MTSKLATRLYLILSALIALAIGGILTFTPGLLHDPSGIPLETANQLSEVRAPGAFLLVSGLWILAGGLAAPLSRGGTVLSVMLYGSYAAGRVLSIMLDGWPSQSLVIALAIEAVLAVVGLGVLKQWKPDRSQCRTPSSA